MMMIGIGIPISQAKAPFIAYLLLTLLLQRRRRQVGSAGRCEKDRLGTDKYQMFNLKFHLEGSNKPKMEFYI